ncbi:collagen alpha-1(I) chain-like isoform X2 [Cuculus canorus]|uniref:collagen alpha-1(I) chain-like isoform X2 n=1 Tax=Cuculus canorus TaxID=55661 RepID=UPI0023AAE539|nr:collagen alpha-1(I) chain-like isoform X2 [Cuculus canorus]
MFAPLRCRRGFPREPWPRQAGQPPPPAHGPPDAWKKPPWSGQCRRGRGQWCPPGSWRPRRFPGPAAFHRDEDRRWGPHDGPLPPPWDNGGDEQGPEDDFKEPGPWDASPFPGPADFCGAEDRRWGPDDGPPLPPWDHGGHEQELEDGFEERGPWGPRPFPGPANFHGNEEDRTWEHPDCPPPPPWNDREDNQGPEDFFREGWFPEPPLPDRDCFAMPEFTEDEQHPLWSPASLAGERGGFQGGYPAWGYRGVGGKRRRHFRQSYRELTLIHQDVNLTQRLPCPQPSRGNRPPSRSSSLPGKSQLKAKEEPQHRDLPQPLTSFKDAPQSGEQAAQDPAEVSKKVPEPPEPASTPLKSPAADPQAATETVEQEQAAGAMLVEPPAEQKPPGSHSQSSCAFKTEPAQLEESSAGTEEHPKVELCSQSVPTAGEDGKSHCHGPTASPEPAERVHEAAGSFGEVTPGAATKPNTQGDSDTCTAPGTSLGTQHLPGSAETEPAASSRPQLCSALLKSCSVGKDPRSTAILAKKEEIELSYQQFSLTMAVVAAMLLQKEPSMEASLGLALRANLRQGWMHYLRELEDFIDSYDSATLTR